MLESCMKYSVVSESNGARDFIHSEFFFFLMCETVRTAPVLVQPLPPEYGPPPYEAQQPGFLPPHVPGEGPMPMPMPIPQPPPGDVCL